MTLRGSDFSPAKVAQLGIHLIHSSAIAVDTQQLFWTICSQAKEELVKDVNAEGCSKGETPDLKILRYMIKTNSRISQRYTL